VDADNKNQAIMLRETCIKQTLEVFAEDLCITLWHCYLLPRVWFLGNFN